MQKKNLVIDFGKKEFKELMIPMALFILIVTVITCIVAICESCVGIL